MNIVDYDNDGDLDLISGDAEGGKGENWFYENLGSEFKGKEKFKEHKFPERFDTHDTRVADVDGDGDLDMASKPWSAGNLHVYWKNMHVENGGKPLNWERAPMGSHNWYNPNRPKKKGCTDMKAENFDFWATGDDGSCKGSDVIVTIKRNFNNFLLQVIYEKGELNLKQAEMGTRVLSLTNARGKTFPIQQGASPFNYRVSPSFSAGAYWVGLEANGDRGYKKIMVVPR